ncbi:hypothetical protein ACNOYE_29580 [Nannocystaceae bacterium ST9]
MNTRQTSGAQDGVFISAADLFSLLSIVLLVFVVLWKDESTRVVEIMIPRASGPDTSKPNTRIEATWKNAGTQCFIVVEGAHVGSFEVTCNPKNVVASGAIEKDDALKELRQSLGESKVLVLCPIAKEETSEIVDKAFADCSRLQWTLINHGFQPVLMVREPRDDI